MADPFVTRLRLEADAWVDDGTITAEQRDRIVEQYPDAELTSSHFFAVLSLIGATLVATGVSLVVGHNWERLSDGVKIGGLIALMSGLYGLAFEVRERAFRKTGEALLMAAGALFLCGIALVGQIYHLNSRPPNAVLLWVLTILPIACLLKTTPLFFLAASGGLIWLGMEGARPDSLLHLGRPGGGSLDQGMRMAAPAIGAFLVAMGTVHPRIPPGFRRVLESLGLLLLLGGLYTLSFEDRLFDQRGRPWSDEVPGPIVFFGVLAAVAIAVAWRSWPEPKAWKGIFAAILLMGVLTGAWTLYLIPPMGSDGASDALRAAWCCIFDVVAALVVISTGIQRRQPGWISIGLFFVGLNILTRYFIHFGTRLDQGLTFLGAGLLLLTLSIVLERQRRKLTRRAREGSAA